MSSDFTGDIERARKLQAGGDYAAAINVLLAVLEKDSDQLDTLLMIGAWQVQRGDIEDGLGWFEQALAAHPSSAVAHNYKGIALRRLGKPAEAVSSFRRALVLKPGYSECYNNLGAALLAASDLAGAKEALTKAAELDNSFSGAFSNLCSVLNEMRDADGAIKAGTRAIELDPDSPAAWSNLGEAFHLAGSPEKAFEHFEKALDLEADFPAALNGLGNLLQDTGKLEQAGNAYAAAIEKSPSFARAHNNLGNVRLAQGRLSEAATCFESALKHEPGIANARTQLLATLKRACEWEKLNRLLSQDSATRGALRDVFPFEALGLTPDPATQLAVATAFAKKTAPKTASRRVPVSSSPKVLKVGYYSADFRTHPVAQLLSGLLRYHDRSLFEVHGLSFGLAGADGRRDELADMCDVFSDMSKASDREVAAHIRKAGINILVDLTGFTRFGRTGVLAARPAPVQVSYLGFPGTSGADFVDYLIGDRHVSPKEHQSFFTEQLVQLPNCYQINDYAHTTVADPRSRRQVGLPPRGQVLCCFNSPAKITAPVFAMWMEVLKQRPNAVLWLIDDNPDATANLKQAAIAAGVTEGRLIFAPRVPLDEHLARHQHADLFLDTYPYGAHTTASDALWAGTPIVTRAGASFASRVAASLLDATGLAELVTQSDRQYLEVVLKLTSDVRILPAIKAELIARKATAPAFDAAKTTHAIELAYKEMWRQFMNGETPSGFALRDA